MLKRIPVADIFGNPDQPRKHFAEAELRELAASIRVNGLLQPITVRPEGDRWMIVAGERRWRAHQLLADDRRFGTILCLVSKVEDAQLAIDAIIENDQRVDVNIIEQANAYQAMIEQHGYAVSSLAVKIGKPERHVQDRLNLLALRPDYQSLAASGQLYQTQASYMATLSPTGQDMLFRKIQQGMCRTVTALRDIAEAIRASETQADIFGDVDAPPAPSAETVRLASGFEAKVEAIAAMLRAGIEDNTIAAVRKVNPGRAGHLAELLAQMAKDLHRIEAALRVAAVQAELTGLRDAA